MSSLRRQLLVWLLPSTLLAGALASAGAYWGAAEELAALLDEQLRYVAEHVTLDSGRVSVDMTNVYSQRLRDERADEVLVEVWQGQQRHFTSNPALRLPAPAGKGFSDVAFAGQTWHTFALERGDRLIRVAQAKDERWEALARVAVHLFWPVASLVPVLAVVLWFGIGRGLRPLQQIASQLSTRDASGLAPVVPERLPSEVKPLVDALNQMLFRLDRAFALQREFVADAAHELRTPVMALSVQAEIAHGAQTEAERTAALAQLKAGITRLGHLAQQLLTLARLEPDARAPEPERVDLVALGKSVILAYVDLAEAKQLDLGLAERDQAFVLGVAEHLRILLGNLIDNAIRFTPAGGRIDVAVRHEAGGIVLEVRDDGPGIPAEEHTRVFDRFYRVGHSNQPGSGLGLSIVKRIADAHGAGVRVIGGPNVRGACVQVTFRPMTRTMRQQETDEPQ
jgi:signal transduction histidine kinase